MLLPVAFATFVATALIGVGLSVVRLQRSANPPAAGAVVHGVFAGLGTVLIVAAAVTHGVDGLLVLAGVALGLAAIGGLTLSALHRIGRTIPVFGIMAHAVVALSGLIALGAALWLLP